MAESLVSLVRGLRAALVSFQPEVYAGEDCAVLVEELAAVEKISAAARVGLGVGAGAGGSAANAEVRRSVLAAQALVGMMENGGGNGKADRADLVIVCDLRAYRRGHAHDGEPCHIVGGGPIPVSLAKELGRDAFLKAVLHDGTELHTIAHFGRRYPAVLRTALDLGEPPDFNGNVCAAPGCDRRYHLQRDHIDPVANGGLTSYATTSHYAHPTTGSRPNTTAKPASSAARNPQAPTPPGKGRAVITRVPTDLVSCERGQRRRLPAGSSTSP